MKTRFRTIVLIVAGVAAVLFAYRIRAVLTPFILGGLLAYLAAPFVGILERRGVPRAHAILIVYLALGLGVFALTASIVPRLFEELEDIIQGLPAQSAQLQKISADMLRRLRRVEVPGTAENIINDTIARVQDTIERFARRLLEIAFSVVSGFLYFVIAPVLGFYILRDSDKFKAKMISAVPEEKRRDLVTLLGEIDAALSGYIRGQLVVSLFVGTMVALGLWILGVKFSLLLGITAGLFNIIPYFGAFIGAIPAMFIALGTSVSLAVWVAALFVAVNQIESLVISPRIVGKRVGLHPLVVIFAVLVGGNLFGFVGMLLAVPGAAVIKVLGGYLWKRFR